MSPAAVVQLAKQQRAFAEPTSRAAYFEEMPSISADGWVLLIHEAITFLVPLAIVLLGLYAAVRFGVKHGLRDSRREERTNSASRTAVEGLELPDPRM